MDLKIIAIFNKHFNLELINKQKLKQVYLTFSLISIICLVSCKKEDALSFQPELAPLQEGLKTSAAIAYCASVAHSAFNGKSLPSNVSYVKNTGFIYIKVDAAHPLPFNSNIGDIVIAGLWNGNNGVISILFSNIDLLNSSVKLYGLYTIPVVESLQDSNQLVTAFAKEDIIVGSGSDTILNISNMSASVFNNEVQRTNTSKPDDAYVAVKQNIWIVDIDLASAGNNPVNDTITINGGGQIVEAASSTGGILYHAMINCQYNYASCSKNPTIGNALSQNFQASNDFLDLGSTYLSFHNSCDGNIYVNFSSGKYIGYNGKDVSLGLP